MARRGSSKQQYRDYLERRKSETEPAKALDTPGGGAAQSKPDWTSDQPKGKRKASRPARALLMAFW
jgi:hypothetical protein